MRGFTFIEVLVAILVLAAIVFAATPNLSAVNTQKLDLAASEVAAALRFARSEAMRTGEVHAVLVDEVAESVTVEKMDLSTKPASVDSVLYHPIAKQPFVRRFPDNPATREVYVDNDAPAFTFVSREEQRVMFNARGEPVFIDTVSDTTEQLVLGAIELELRDVDRDVLLQPYTGRVTVD